VLEYEKKNILMMFLIDLSLVSWAKPLSFSNHYNYLINK